MALSFNATELEQMQRVENDVARTVAPFALLRCARLLLRLYPERAQQDLLSVIVPFLQGGPPPPGAEREPESRVLLQ